MFSRRFIAKRAESPKFPAFFPASREFATLYDCALDPRPSRQGADRWGTEHARNTHTRLGPRNLLRASAQKPERRIGALIPRRRLSIPAACKPDHVDGRDKILWGRPRDLISCGCR